MRPKLMDWEGERVPKINEIWMLACIKNSLKNRWFWRPKLKNLVKKTFPKTIYFSHAFFDRFWRGLGRVLGGQNGEQIEIFGIFLDMLVETLFLVEFC